MVAVKDAVRQVTELDYEHSNPLVTKVTDPFARFTTLIDDGSGRLASITDVTRMTSSFTYGVEDCLIHRNVVRPLA